MLYIFQFFQSRWVSLHLVEDILGAISHGKFPVQEGYKIMAD